MRRGTLELTREELVEIDKRINYQKFKIAVENIQDVNRVFLNENEIESFMDNLGPNDDNDTMNNVRGKLSKLLRSI